MSTRRPVRAVGIDTGGTFTDFVALVGGRIVALKLPSSPRAPERPVLDGLARLGVGATTEVRHGSTVATNALLERRGARVTLVTTAGFEDLLEIGRQDRPQLYSLAPRRVEPLVPAARRLGVQERLGPGGVTWRRLLPREIARTRRRVAASRPEAVAIVLLHAYANGAHERALARALRALGVPVTVASELCPEVREYERLATVVTNAYLAPRVSAYIERLARGTPARLEIVLSHGGTAPPQSAAREPVRQLLSGPAAGLRAARDVAAACGFARALTLDVGGTSTDCAFVDGALPRRRGAEIGGFPVLLPVLDVHTVGAGGGSIAEVDAGGLLHVGPRSAGADPGPACYGRGGPATLTDALVVLGRIPGDALAGGALALDRVAAERALVRLARTLRMRDVRAAAAGVVAVAESHMAAALRRVSVERGRDPRGAALVAFGGAGGLHACALAEALAVRHVVFPRHAGLLSAIGALTGGSCRERSRSVLLDAADRRGITRALAELEAQARAEFDRAGRARLRLERRAEMRYRGQSHELSIAVGPRLAERFHRAHRERFGFADRAAAVEVVTLEVRALRTAPRVPAAAWRSDAAPGAARRTTVWASGRRLAAASWERAALDDGRRRRGPAIVTESGATLWVPPGWTLRAHRSGAVVVTR